MLFNKDTVFHLNQNCKLRVKFSVTDMMYNQREVLHGCVLGYLHGHWQNDPESYLHDGIASQNIDKKI